MRWLLCVLLTFGAARPTFAQDTAQDTDDSLSEASARVRLVFVQTTTSGTEIRGRLIDLAHNTITLASEGRRVTIPLEHVLRIDAGGDSLRNGALIGAIIYGGLCALVCRMDLRGGSYAAAVAINTGVGALIGPGIDAAIPGRTTLYRRTAVEPAMGKTAALSFKVKF